MANSMALSHLAIILAINIFIAGPTYAQINTPCNPSTLSTLFTPCMSFLTNSSANGTSPTTQCCTALKSLTSGGMDCLCLIVTASVPFKIPINRTLAISLPRACKMPGVPVQCKASASPLPAPGPMALGPSLSPASSPSLSGFTPTPSPQASSDLPSPTSSPLAPQQNTNAPLLAPPSPSVDSNTPSTSTTGSGHSSLTPSSAVTSYSVSPSVLLIALGIVTLKYY
ncbi:non-specific lipid transfer protein GPI-anchored 20-like [Vicia villosa]|uniref:non-specific lipid transfer protein GPI-anchored 20-like n=1 Tax=Vicia villosa TaxID=3911 RepID=UPI00273C9F85|nr:non-specific lipid transfer protein GPI-anchored 20-like [Vicia villosa]